MSELIATTLNGQMMLGKHIADVPNLKDGEILDSEDCDLVWQWEWEGSWIQFKEEPNAFTKEKTVNRQAYILKSQPKKDLPSINETYDKLGIDYSEEPSQKVGALVAFHQIAQVTTFSEWCEILEQQGFTLTKQP
jgi:hypothetical protein